MLRFLALVLGVLCAGVATGRPPASLAAASPRDQPAAAAPRSGPIRGGGQIGASTWTSLAGARPLWIARSTTITGQSLAADVADPRRIAYCAPDAIQVTEDGGATWRTVPTAPVAEAAAAAAYPLLAAGGVTPACTSLALDPAFPDSLYAVFRAEKAPFGAPPIVFVGYHTADGGQSWQAVPAPDGATTEQFGGFRASGVAVQALFARPGPGDDTVPSFIVEQTADGGRTWEGGRLDCPPTGPCVQWGPAPNTIGSCAMNERIQPIEVSSDGGQSWTPAVLPGPGPFPGPGGANACNLNELAALSATEVLVIAEDAPASADPGLKSGPVMLSRDGGLTWDVVTLPALPGPSLQLLRGLQMLPDGALIVRSQESAAWLMLLPGAPAWCPISPDVLDASLESADSARVIDGRLWWLENTSGAVPPTNAQPIARSVSLDDLRCAAGG